MTTCELTAMVEKLTRIAGAQQQRLEQLTTVVEAQQDLIEAQSAEIMQLSARLDRASDVVAGLRHRTGKLHEFAKALDAERKAAVN